MADDRAKAFKADQDRIAQENEEQISRTDGLQPTPTQEENDRAKLGVDSLEELDDKEADGSEEQRAVSTAGAGSAGAQNRSISTKSK